MLLLAFPFPPARAIGGVRCANLAKYLSRLGWKVTVVTVDPRLLADPDPAVGDMEQWFRTAGVARTWTGHALRMFLGGYLVERWWERLPLMNKLAGALVRWLGVDRGVGWVRPVLRACAGYRPGDFDVILASGSPFSSFRAAGMLGRRLKARVVLDYRDLWTMAPHDPRMWMAGTEMAERRALKDASKVLVVSEAMATCLRNKYGFAEKYAVVTNGFDPESFQDIVPARYSQPTIVYAGTFYPPLRIVDPLLDVLCRVNQAGHRLRFLYLGPHGESVRRAAAARGALEWVEIHGRVPRPDVYAAIKGALAAAVITSVKRETSPEIDSILTGKLYEAMGCGTPVLLIAPPGSEAARVVTQTGAGRAFAGDEIAGMAEWLLEQVAEAGNGPKSMNAYSWPEIAGQVDRLLRQISA